MIESVMPTYKRFDLTFEKGEGASLWTVDGRRFVDFGSGIAVNLLGHGHPALVSALQEQAGSLWHLSNMYQSEGQKRLAEKLCANSFADTIFFCNSGAEAMEGCIKTARKYQSVNDHPERYRVISFEGGFHGRTLATMAAGGQDKILSGFGPKADGFDQAPFGDLKAAAALIGPETAAILLEPIQGEGGVRVAEPAFLRGLRALCDKHDLLLLMDEVQCGMGRTGKLFAHEWADITPDVLGVAKGIGGGFPLGAVLATEKAAAGMVVGSHGSTFGGNMLAMAVGNAVVDAVLADGFLDRVNAIANRLKQGMAGIVDRYPSVVRGVRGVGLMMGLECVVGNAELCAKMHENQVLSVMAGDNVLRLLPPLNVSDEEVAAALESIEAACADLAVEASAA